MKNEIHNLVPGSDEWLKFRLERGGASEAAAMLGLSTKVKRSELLRMKHTGLPKEFSDWVQTHVLDHGHEVEAMARPLFEEIIGDELYPAVYSRGRLGASTDGLTMSGRVAWEHKQWSEELARSVAADILPEEHWPQCQQVLLVTGADHLVFGVSDGTPDKLVSMVVFPDPVWFDRIERGWAQFWIDLANFAMPEAEAPKPAGATMESLPALQVLVEGSVTKSNLTEWVGKARALVASISTELATDEDFATAENMVKGCEKAEQLLEATKSNMLAQTVSIDEVLKTIDQVREEFRQKRLALDKLVKAKKESIKGDIVAGGVAAFAEHVRGLACEYLPRVVPDFAGAIKNKRTVASLRDAVDTELARAKIEVNGHYARIQQNLTTLAAPRTSHRFLFVDVGALVIKAPDDLALIIRTRIADHEAAAEKELARIREEERVKAEAKARHEAEEAARLAAAAAAAATAPTPAPVPTAPAAVPIAAPAAPMRAAPAPAPKADEPATLNLGAISERLEFTVPGTLMLKYGFDGAPGPRGSKLYTESQFDRLCFALQRHIETVRLGAKEAAEA